MRTVLIVAAVMVSACRATPMVTKPAQSSRLNVRDFGAVGDGTTDDTKSLHAAFAAACDGRGATLYVPAGRYRYTRTIRLVGRDCSNVIVQGDGPASTLLFAGEGPAETTFNDRAFYVESGAGPLLPISAPIEPGARTFATTVSAAADLRPGDWLVIFDQDAKAAEVVAIDWAQVREVSEATVQVEHPFRTAFTGHRRWVPGTSGLAFYRLTSLLENVTLRDLRIENVSRGRNAALINIGMALRTRLDSLTLENASGNGLAIYRAKDVGIQNVTVTNARRQANEIAATVDFRIINSSFGFERSPAAGVEGVGAALDIDFGSAFFTVTASSFHAAGDIAVMFLDGVHDGVFIANSIGWVRDSSIGVGQGVSARGTQRLVFQGNAFAGGDRGAGNTCITFADSTSLEIPIASAANVISDNSCPNFANVTGPQLQRDRYKQ